MLVIAVVVGIVVANPSGCWNGRNITATLSAVIAAVANADITVHALHLSRILFGHVHDFPTGLGR